MKVTGTWKGLEVAATVTKSWEGDPSVPNGTRNTVDIEDLEVTSSDGSDMYDYLTDDAIECIEEYLMEQANEDNYDERDEP